MKNKLFAWGVLTWIFLQAAIAAQESLARFLPGSDNNETLEKWILAPHPQEVSGENLYLLIDGGAEIFHEYGFKQAMVAEYHNPAGGSVNVEIYQMNDATCAYGIFSFKRGAKSQSIGIGGEAFSDDYYLHVWQGDYLIALTALDRNDNTKNALVPMAEKIIAKIPAFSEKPRLIRLLENSMPEKAIPVYIKGNLALFNHLVNSVIKSIPVKEGVIWKFPNYDLIILSYADPTETQQQWETLKLKWLQKQSLLPSVQDQAHLVFSQGLENELYLEKWQKYIFIIQIRGKVNFLESLRQIKSDLNL